MDGQQARDHVQTRITMVACGNPRHRGLVAVDRIADSLVGRDG